jgi:metallo-beta-lactamase class B
MPKLKALSTGIAWFVVGMSCTPAPSPTTVASVLPPPSTQVAGAVPPLEVRALTARVLQHTSWKYLPGVGPFPSNGLVVLADDRAVLIDTAWGDEPTLELLGRVEREYGRKVTDVVVTHAHDDRLGGIRTVLARGITVYASEATAALAERDGWPRPTRTFRDEMKLDLSSVEERGPDSRGLTLEAFFPGAGHSPDNVVVFVSGEGTGEGVLFGTCMVREAEASSLGNLADAVPSAWSASLEAIVRRFPKTPIVVPGHGRAGGASLLTHTRALVDDLTR